MIARTTTTSYFDLLNLPTIFALTNNKSSFGLISIATQSTLFREIDQQYEKPSHLGVRLSTILDFFKFVYGIERTKSFVNQKLQ